MIGAVWGAIVGFVAQWATNGQRDFASVVGLAAAQYDVMVANGQAEVAGRLIAASSPG